MNFIEWTLYLGIDWNKHCKNGVIWVCFCYFQYPWLADPVGWFLTSLGTCSNTLCFFCLDGPQSGMVFWSGINFPYIRAKQNRKKRNQWLASRVLGQLWRVGSDAWGFRRSKRTLGPWLCRTSPEPCPSKRSEESGGKKLMFASSSSNSRSVKCLYVLRSSL